MSEMEASDAHLLERWRRGDREAGKELFTRYYDPLERFFANKVPTGIGDLVQDTFRMCLEACERIEDPSKFRSYLFSIAFNVLRGHFRTKGRRGTEIALEKVSMRDVLPGAVSVLVERQEQRLLLEGLRSIPVNDQVILELHYWESLKIDEIAKVLDVAPSAVKGRLFRARRRLERTLRQLAESPEVLASTLANLDDWARQCREEFQQRAR